MLKYADQRRFPRMEVECPARFRVMDENEATGAIVKNLSGSGLLMWIDHEVEVGTRMTLEVYPKMDVTPPLYAEVEVVRTVDVEDGNFAIACQIERVLDEGEVTPTLI